MSQRSLTASSEGIKQGIKRGFVALKRQSLTQKAIAEEFAIASWCKLFGEDGNVPEDLTVSQLYQMYWDLRIATSRKPHADIRRMGMVKKNLALHKCGMNLDF